MECFVCNSPEAEIRPSTGDRTLADCPACGSYSVSGTVVHFLEQGRWLHTEATQQWLEEQRRDGEAVPLIKDENVIWDGVWQKG